MDAPLACKRCCGIVSSRGRSDTVTAHVRSKISIPSRSVQPISPKSHLDIYDSVGSWGLVWWPLPIGCVLHLTVEAESKAVARVRLSGLGRMLRCTPYEIYGKYTEEARGALGCSWGAALLHQVMVAQPECQPVMRSHDQESLGPGPTVSTNHMSAITPRQPPVTPGASSIQHYHSYVLADYCRRRIVDSPGQIILVLSRRPRIFQGRPRKRQHPSRAHNMRSRSPWHPIGIEAVSSCLNSRTHQCRKAPNA
jgi:hypothetical protein